MNKVLIVDASESDRRLMSGLLVKSGYEPIAVETMEAAKDEVAKLPPGAVIVADVSLRDGSAKELINYPNVHANIVKAGQVYVKRFNDEAMATGTMAIYQKAIESCR